MTIPYVRPTTAELRHFRELADELADNRAAWGHATLAHAAATALVNETEKNLKHGSTGAGEYRAWQHAAARTT